MDVRQGMNRFGILAGALVSTPCAVAVFLLIFNVGWSSPGQSEVLIPLFIGSIIMGPLVVFSVVLLAVWFFFFALGWVIAGFQPTPPCENNSESTDVHHG